DAVDLGVIVAVLDLAEDGEVAEPDALRSPGRLAAVEPDALPAEFAVPGPRAGQGDPVEDDMAVHAEPSRRYPKRPPRSARCGDCPSHGGRGIPPPVRIRPEIDQRQGSGGPGLGG